MANSGTLNTSDYGGRYLTFNWSVASQSIANNTTTINWSLKGNGGATNVYYMAGAFGVSINGSSAYHSDGRIQLFNGTVVASGQATIGHNADGSKSFGVYVEAGIYTYAVNVSGSATFNLPTIPRATTPTLSTSNLTTGSAVTISMNRASSAFTHTLTYAFGNTSGTIGTGLGTSASWTPPKSLANQIPNAQSGWGTITCKTYNGGTLIGTKSVTFTLNISSDIVPSISKVLISGAGDVHLAVFVQNYSKVKIDTTASGTYGSTIKSISVEFDGVTYSGASVTSGIQYTSGTKSVKVTVTDSRGKTATWTGNVTILAYLPPKITKLEAHRCDANGNLKDDGKYVKISYAYETTHLNNQNQISLKIATDTTAFINQSPVDYERNTSMVTSAVFEIDKSYDIVMTLKDEFQSNTARTYVPTDKTIFDVLASGNGIAFGKVAETDNLFDVAFDARFRKPVTFYQDTNWINLTLASSWATYNSDASNTPRYKVSGNIVEIRGQITPKATHTSSATRETIATLPSYLAPSKDIYVLCQGSGKNTWLLSIQTDGEITFSRYGVTGFIDVPSGAWLPFQITYNLG